MAHKNKDWYLRYFLCLLEENKAQGILEVKAYFLCKTAEVTREIVLELEA